MIYLLDANVLIDANRDYYPIERVPEFWLWLEHHGTNGTIKIPFEVFEEVKVSKDDLGKWAKKDGTAKALLLAEEPDPSAVSAVIDKGYAPDLKDDETESLGRDPFLIAYAFVAPADRCVVTTERSRPSRIRANRHVPDVCKGFGIRCCNTFELVRELNFRTNWKG